MDRTINAILFDLDNTLYDARAGLQEVGDRNITDWIVERLGISRPEADELRLRTWREYGTTAKGLEMEYGINGRELYEATISSINPAEVLAPWPELEQMLRRLSVDCHVFTNSTAVYARGVLAALGIDRFFDHIFDIEYCGWVCKPNEDSYHRIVAELALPPERIAFVEDNPGNLVPAKKMGMLTVWLDNRGDGGDDWDLHIESILDLADALEAAC